MSASKNRSTLRSRYRQRIKNNLLFGILIVLIISATVVLALKPDLINWSITSIPEDKPALEGIDVSNHQGRINWLEIDQDAVNFVFIKATEGTTFKDKSFSYNWNVSREAGFLRGAYHYFNIESDGQRQAENFISMVPRENSTLPPVIDIEEVAEDQARLINDLKKYVDTIERHYGLKPIFYVNKQTYELYVRDHFSDYVIWYAVYGSEPPIDNWTFWQHTDSGTVQGIEGPVDMNYFKGNKEDILNLTK